VLVNIDCLTGYVWSAIFASLLSAQQIIGSLDQIYSISGVFPKKIMSDRGAQFASLQWTHLLRLRGSCAAVAAPYHLELDGIMERAIQSVQTKAWGIIAETNCIWVEPDIKGTKAHKRCISTKTARE
jgi:hypothetical protein